MIFILLHEGERAELINGQIYYIASPARKHQKISGKLHQAIANYIDSRHGKCEIYAAPFAVFLNQDDTNMETLLRICKALHCGILDVIELQQDEICGSDK